MASAVSPRRCATNVALQTRFLAAAPTILILAAVRTISTNQAKSPEPGRQRRRRQLKTHSVTAPLTVIVRNDSAGTSTFPLPLTGSYKRLRLFRYLPSPSISIKSGLAQPLLTATRDKSRAAVPS